MFSGQLCLVRHEPVARQADDDDDDANEPSRWLPNPKHDVDGDGNDGNNDNHDHDDGDADNADLIGKRLLLSP